MQEIDLTEILKKYDYRIKLEIDAPHNEIREVIDGFRSNTICFNINKIVVDSYTFDKSINKITENIIVGRKLKTFIPPKTFYKYQIPKSE